MPAATPSALIHHALAKHGRQLPADTDQALAATGRASLLLIHVPPGEYAFEQHAFTEFIICVDGHIDIDTVEGAAQRAVAGEMIEITPDIRHRFGATSDAVILTIAQRSAP